MELCKLKDSFTEIRSKIHNRLNSLESQAKISRHSSGADIHRIKFKEIPNSVNELLSRYGSSRMKIRSYKKDAIELLGLVLNKPIRRFFFSIKSFKDREKISKLLKFKDKKILLGKKKMKTCRLERSTSNKDFLKKIDCGNIKILELRLSKLVKKSKHYGFNCICIYFKKRVSINVILIVLSRKCAVVKKRIFGTIKELFKKNKRRSLRTLIPPLNLEVKSNSKIFSKIIEKSGNLPPTGLQNKENVHSRMNLLSTLTDRRCEKYPQLSTLPSSIYSESDNSATDRLEIQKASKKSSKCIEIKDFDIFFEFGSFQDAEKKNESKRSFFDNNIRQKQNSELLSTHCFIMKDFYKKAVNHFQRDTWEKKLRRIFRAWKRASQGPRWKGSRFIKHFFAKYFRLIKECRLKRGFEFLKNHSKFAKIWDNRIDKMIKNLKKDVEYRLIICFKHWKTETELYKTDQLRFVSLGLNMSNLYFLRKSWAFNSLKSINKLYKLKNS